MPSRAWEPTIAQSPENIPPPGAPQTASKIRWRVPRRSPSAPGRATTPLKLHPPHSPDREFPQRTRSVQPMHVKAEGRRPAGRLETWRKFFAVYFPVTPQEMLSNPAYGKTQTAENPRWRNLFIPLWKYGFMRTGNPTAR